MAEPRCPLCAGAARLRFQKPGGTVCSCPACGLVFTLGEWPAARARSFYSAGYFSGHDAIGYSDYGGLERALRKTAAARVQRLPRGGRGLDIGCGPGVLCDVARGRFRSIGSDVSAAACLTARGRGIEVVVNDATALPFCDRTYDVVTMWDTLEHLADPLAGLREVARVLRPGGVLALSTGDVSSWCARLSGRYWHLFTLPEHRYFFSLSTLDRLLAAAGLQRRAAYHAGAHYSLAYLVERLIKSFGGTTRWAAAVLRRSWLNRTVVYVNLFDIITVEAVKLPALSQEPA